MIFVSDSSTRLARRNTGAAQSLRRLRPNRHPHFDIQGSGANPPPDGAASASCGRTTQPPARPQEPRRPPQLPPSTNLRAAAPVLLAPEKLKILEGLPYLLAPFLSMLALPSPRQSSLPNWTPEAPKRFQSHIAGEFQFLYLLSSESIVRCRYSSDGGGQSDRAGPGSSLRHWPPGTNS